MNATIIDFSSMTKKLENPPNRIREQRQARRMTLQALAAKTGMDAAYISKMETGDRSVKMEHLRAIGAAMGLAIGDLLNADDVPESLTDAERAVVQAMREDAAFAHNASVLAEARSSFKPAPVITPFKKAG